MWKDFFYYSKSERRAVYALLVLLVLFSLGIMLAPEFPSREVEAEQVSDSLKEQSFLAEISKRERKKFRSSGVVENAVVLKSFDPNLSDSIELLGLGLPAYVVRNVLKYRDAGGRFTSPESFSRIYGLTDKKYQELKPYIQITSISKPKLRPKDTLVMKKEQQRFEKPFKYPEGTVVDVNVVDTVELKKIPGVGSTIARSIVVYRERLGGFYSLEQLGEVKYFTPSLMKWFTLGELPVRPLQINRLSLDKLRAHPYLNFYQAKAIVEHRKKKGDIKSLSQLSLYEEFAEKDLKRLSAYLNFD